MYAGRVRVHHELHAHIPAFPGGEVLLGEAEALGLDEMFGRLAGRHAGHGGAHQLAVRQVVGKERRVVELARDAPRCELTLGRNSHGACSFSDGDELDGDQPRLVRVRFGDRGCHGVGCARRCR